MAINTYIKNIFNHYIKYSEEEQIALIKKSREGDNDAREKVICANLPLVIWIVKKKYYFLDMEESIQEGNFGLIKAIDNYCFSKPYREYLYFKICREISSKISPVNGIHFSSYANTSLNKMKNYKKKFYSEFNRDPNYEELKNGVNSIYTQISDKLFKTLYSYLYSHIISLDKKISNDNEETLKDSLPRELTLFPKLLTEFQIACLNELKNLPYQYNTVLKDIYFNNQTQASIARKENLCREAIRQRQNQALKILRKRIINRFHNLKSKGTLEEMLKFFSDYEH